MSTAVHSVSCGEGGQIRTGRTSEKRTHKKVTHLSTLTTGCTDNIAVSNVHRTPCTHVVATLLRDCNRDRSGLVVAQGNARDRCCDTVQHHDSTFWIVELTKQTQTHSPSCAEHERSRGPSGAAPTMMAVEAWFESSTARVAADRGSTSGLPEGAPEGEEASSLHHAGRSMGVRMLDAFAARERASSPSTGSWMSQRPL